MVHLAVHKFGQRRPVCFARPLLYQATAAISRKDPVSAGCYLRESVRRFLVAECEAFEVKPRHKSPLGHAQSLKKAGHLDAGMFRWIADIIKCSNRAAHCCYVKLSLLEFGVAVLHANLDNSPELEIPTRGGQL